MPRATFLPQRLADALHHRNLAARLDTIRRVSDHSTTFRAIVRATSVRSLLRRRMKVGRSKRTKLETGGGGTTARQGGDPDRRSERYWRSGRAALSRRRCALRTG